MLVPLLPSVPLWSRFFTALFLFLIARFVRIATRRGDVTFLLVAAKILLVRDIAATFLPIVQPALLPVVRVSGEIAVYLMLLRWTGRYRRTNRTFIAAIAGSSVAVAVFGMSWFLGANAAMMRRVVIYLTPLLLFAVTFVAILRIDRFSYRRAREVETIKPYLQVALMGQSVLYAAVPLSFAVFESVVAITALAPFVILSLYAMHYALQEQRERTRSLRRNTRSLFGFLSGVGRSLGSGRDPETILRAAIDTMVEATDADAGVAIISEAGQIRVCAVNGLFPPPVAVPDIVKTKQGALRGFLMSLDITHDMPVWGAALASGTARIIEDAAQEPAFKDHAADRVLHLRSVLVLPLVVRHEVLGLLSVIRRESSRRFTAVEFDHARTMANFVAVTLDNYYSYRIQREIEIAGDIQNRLQAPPTLRNGVMEFAGTSRPALGVGGDYYDVIPLGDDRTAVLICDVSGKGVPAALVMVMVRTIAHIVLQQTQDAGEVLKMINAGVSGALELDRFATASVIIFEPRLMRLSFANAGHHPALVHRVDAPRITELDADGLPIGIEADGEYPSRTIAFTPGSTLVLFTDGVVEAFDAEGRSFGSERLISLLQTLSNGSDWNAESSSVLSTMMASIDDFVAGAAQHDDMTMLICRFVDEEPAKDATAG